MLTYNFKELIYNKIRFFRILKKQKDNKMAVITHIEFKVICDNCSSDVTGWFHAKNKTIATKVARSETGMELKRGSQFCEDCEQPKDMEARRMKTSKADIDKFFKNAKSVDVFDLMKKGNQ